MFDWLFGRKRPAVPGLQKLSGRKPAQSAPMVRAMPKLPFPIESVHGAQALETYDRLRAAGRGMPVIVGNDESLHRLAERLSVLNQPQGVLSIESQAVAAPFPEAWRLKRQQDLGAYDDAGDEDYAVTGGQWPDNVTPQDFTQHLDLLTQQPLDRVHIAILPTLDPTLIPAFLNFGGWNDCPDAATHVAAARYWHEKYGAEIVAITDDIIEYRVTRRPASREEAMILAQEQFELCSDIVLQGPGTLEPLAATLMASDWWFFWWD